MGFLDMFRKIEVKDSIFPTGYGISADGFFLIDGKVTSWKMEKKKGHYRLYDTTESSHIPVMIGTIHDRTITKFIGHINKSLAKK